MFESILCQVTEYDPDVLESLIELAVEIAREGREGRRVGTLFTLGDEQAVLASQGHSFSTRSVDTRSLLAISLTQISEVRSRSWLNWMGHSWSATTVSLSLLAVIWMLRR